MTIRAGNLDIDFAPCEHGAAVVLRHADTGRHTVTLRLTRADAHRLARQLCPEAFAEHEAERSRWQDATGLLVNGDPDGVTPEHLERWLEKLIRVADAAGGSIRRTRPVAEPLATLSPPSAHTGRCPMSENLSSAQLEALHIIRDRSPSLGIRWVTINSLLDRGLIRPGPLGYTLTQRGERMLGVSDE